MFVFSPQKLEAARTHAGLSREELATKIGRSYPSIVGYERGIHAPPVAVLGRLANVLGVEPLALYEDQRTAELVR